tara:strand:- start:228 stop:671 length:444 start_codon:yes stop_codon:yes gene_type:complete
MSKFITVATFVYPQEAYVIKSRLEADEIPCFLKNELTIQTDNFLSNAMGGVQLQIPESYIEQALPVLEEVGLISKDTAELTKAHYSQTATANETIVCPNCGSDDIVKSKKPGGWYVFFLLLAMIPVPILKKEYHCFECYTDFKVKRR